MATLPILVFDIESIPDISGLRTLRGDAPSSTDAEVYAAWRAEREAAGKSDFAPLHLQRVLCISCVFRAGDDFRVHSFVDRDGASEGRVVQQFFQSIEKHAPQLVSWNGGGFDLPVLHYRGLVHGACAPNYWDQGEEDRDRKFSNYIGRYHSRHVDLMDLLALYQPKNNAPLDAMAKLCGFPGKLGMDGSQVYSAFLAGQTEDIRRYCETDVVNTYLVWTRFQKMRGALDDAQYDREIAFVQTSLEALAPAEPHWREYLDAWK